MVTRKRYDPHTRELAKDLYVHRGLPVEEISQVLNVPKGTLGKWQSADDWVEESGKGNPANSGDSFGMSCEYLMRTIHYMSRRLFLSMFVIAEDHEDESELILPDEKLELRINRLTLALERIIPMGNLLQTKHRVETIKELKQVCFDAVGHKVFDDDEMRIVSRVMDYYLISLTNATSDLNISSSSTEDNV